MTTDTTAIAALVRELRELEAVRRAAIRRAFGTRALPGLAALAALDRCGPLRMSALAECLHVDLSVASRQIGSLESAGHVARRRDPDDGRGQVAEITDSGRDTLAEAHGVLVEGLAGALAGWSDAEVADLTAQVTRLREDYAPARQPRELTEVAR
jgi:DNA-binding MarR family transcriptional regulator